MLTREFAGRQGLPVAAQRVAGRVSRRYRPAQTYANAVTSSTSTTSSEALTAPDLGRGHSLFANASALLAGGVVSLIVPLLTIHYLARVLGPEAWGPIIAAQALGNWLLLFVEFGFELWGTRAVARARTSPEAIPDIVHGVQSAKLLLSLASVAIAAIIYFAIPSLHLAPALIGWATLFGILRGLSPLWFFQGIERVRGAVAVDTVTRIAAALGVFFVVRGASDGVRVLELKSSSPRFHWWSSRFGLDGTFLCACPTSVPRSARLARPGTCSRAAYRRVCTSKQIRSCSARSRRPRSSLSSAAPSASYAPRSTSFSRLPRRSFRA